jgi:hypothetical protein
VSSYLYAQGQPEPRTSEIDVPTPPGVLNEPVTPSPKALVLEQIDARDAQVIALARR